MRFAVRPSVFGTAVTVDMGAGVDADFLVDDIAAHMRGAGQHDFARLDPAVYRSRHFDFFAVDGAVDSCTLSHFHRDAADIALDFAFDVDVLRAFELTGDLERLADDGNRDGRGRGRSGHVHSPVRYVW